MQLTKQAIRASCCNAEGARLSTMHPEAIDASGLETSPQRKARSGWTGPGTKHARNGHFLTSTARKTSRPHPSRNGSWQGDDARRSWRRREVAARHIPDGHDCDSDGDDNRIPFDVHALRPLLADDTIIFMDHDLEQAKNTKGGARCNSYGITVKHVVRWWRYPAIDGCFSAVSCFVIELLVSCVSLLSVLYPGVVSLCSCSSGCSMAQRL
ncbi:hypothetical protein SETIT_1G066800v2 [Setaria italica]|uniref:Uncharacterized protein n=1 Tax=Setaria italica TaxID=4555 RepID=A0A368PHK1_SETIT|nr:hypothetical protein SETIT_1G066800v2 [Setaria italica]